MAMLLSWASRSHHESKVQTDFAGLFCTRCHLPCIRAWLSKQCYLLLVVIWQSQTQSKWQRNDRYLAAFSFRVCPVFLEPVATFHCFPGCQRLAGSLLESFHRGRQQQGQISFLYCISTHTCPFICHSEALLMQGEYIQHREPWRAVEIIMPLFIILKQT